MKGWTVIPSSFSGKSSRNTSGWYLKFGETGMVDSLIE